MLSLLFDFEKENSAFIQATSNAKLIAENTEKIASRQLDYQSFVERTETLETKNKESTNVLEESKNRSMRKTLIFKNIKQPHQREN